MFSKSTQIGGKGSVRRKIKRTGNVFLEKKTKESREYEMKINAINKMIEEIPNEEYPLFKKYIEEELEDMGVSIEKHNFLKAYKVQFNICKEDPYAYIFSLLILNAQRPLKFNPKSFPKLKKMFELDHLQIFIKLIYDTESDLEKKIYLEKN
tara:strand:+ start:584 stop:1039 length:456 start_codon:yes stop_codon:yes gene_type:complete